MLLVFMAMIIEIWILASRYASVQAPWPLFPYCLRMPVLLAVAVLFFMQIVGEALARFTGLPLPGPLLGMLLMLPALTIGRASCRERGCRAVEVQVVAVTLTKNKKT